MSIFTEIIAELIAARKRKGLTQQEVGARAGVPQSHISKIENGGVDLQVSSLIELARALDLELKLIPRSALRIADAAIRSAHGIDDLNEIRLVLTEQLSWAAAIIEDYPELAGQTGFVEAVDKVRPIPNNLEQATALRTALKPIVKLYRRLLQQCADQEVEKRLRTATAALKRYSKTKPENSSPATTFHEPRQIPAYRLEGDDL